MRQNRTAYYADFADFAAYPLLIAVLILLIANKAGIGERLRALAFAFGGAYFWMLLEQVLTTTVTFARSAGFPRRMRRGRCEPSHRHRPHFDPRISDPTRLPIPPGCARQPGSEKSSGG